MLSKNTELLYGQFDQSNALTNRLEKIVPGGAMTYARGADQYPEHMAPIIKRGMGCEVWDVDGNKYIEFGMGLRSVILGHAHPVINAAAAEAMNSGCSFVRPSVMELEAAETMLACVPDMDMIKFCKNGSDATTAAVKLARAWTGRSAVAICADHPFFSVDDWFIGTTPMSSGITPETIKGTLTFPYGDIDALRSLLESAEDPLSCVILEPEKYEPVSRDYLRSVKEVAHAHGALVIFDEMITGFRHHFGGVHVRESVSPDLVTYGKAIGNGFACSALLGCREVMQLGGFEDQRDRVFLLSTTHGAETPALAATIATLNYMRDRGVLNDINERGHDLKTGLNEIAKDLGIDRHFSVVGMPADLVYITRNRNGVPCQKFRTLFMQEAVRRGILAPSFVISHSHTRIEIARTISAIRPVLEIYRNALESGIDHYLQGRPIRPAFRRRG